MLGLQGLLGLLAGRLTGRPYAGPMQAGAGRDGSFSRALHIVKALAECI